jgi:hypothetical protein
VLEVEIASAVVNQRWPPAVGETLSGDEIYSNDEQIEADEKRHPLLLVERQARRILWEESLDEAASLLAEEQLWDVWDTLCEVMGRSWHGSMLAECVNSLLRSLLDGRKHTAQGCPELFRFLHNARPFERGKRANHSPAELVGLDVPDNPLVLLGLSPKRLYRRFWRTSSMSGPAPITAIAVSNVPRRAHCCGWYSTSIS